MQDQIKSLFQSLGFFKPPEPPKPTLATPPTIVEAKLQSGGDGKVHIELAGQHMLYYRINDTWHMDDGTVLDDDTAIIPYLDKALDSRSMVQKRIRELNDSC